MSRRGAAVADGVLTATLELLAEHGFEFTIEDVAGRAGVHKTTVYRRWETKPVLVAAAIAQLAAQDVPVVRSDDALADLAALTVRVARALRQPAGANALRAALSTAGADSELRSVTAGFLASRYAAAVELVRAAQDDGTVRADVDPTLLWQAVINPLHVNAVTGGALDDATALALLDLVLRGAATTVGTDTP